MRGGQTKLISAKLGRARSQKAGVTRRAYCVMGTAAVCRFAHCLWRAWQHQKSIQRFLLGRPESSAAIPEQASAMMRDEQDSVHSKPSANNDPQRDGILRIC